MLRATSKGVEGLPGEQETILIGPAAPLAAHPPRLPAGVRVREVFERANLDRIVATLRGGSTLEPFRRLGIYRALVAWRARRAVDRGYSLLQVDASPNSRPILDRLGFVVVTTSTPYVNTP